MARPFNPEETFRRMWMAMGKNINWADGPEGQRLLETIRKKGSSPSFGTGNLFTDFQNDLLTGKNTVRDKVADMYNRFYGTGSYSSSAPSTPKRPGKITAQQFFEGKKANVPTTPATPNVVTRPVQPNLPAYGPMQQSSYPKIEITPATQSTSPHNARIRGVQLDQPQPMQGPRSATQLGPQRPPIQGPRMSTPPISSAGKAATSSRFAGGLQPLGGLLNKGLNILGRVGGVVQVVTAENPEDRLLGAAQVWNPLYAAAMGTGLAAGKWYEKNVPKPTTEYISPRGEGYLAFQSRDQQAKQREAMAKSWQSLGLGKPTVNTEDPKLADIRGSITPGSSQPAANNLGEGAAFDAAERFRAGAGYPAGMPRPADYPVQSNAPTSPIEPPVDVDPRGPSAKEVFDKYFAMTKNVDQATELARNEGLRIWAQKHEKLAKRIKPGHRDYEQVQIGLGRMPSLAGQVATQAFADNAIKNFSDTLKMDTVMPEGTTLGVADDLDEAYAKVSDPAFTEAIQRAFTSGLNLGTGSRVSTPPKRGTKPSQPFFEARTPGL